MAFDNATPTYHVLGGDGSNSYSKNSEFQKKLVDSSKEMINELISKHLNLKTPSSDLRPSLRIADYGCSVGPNAFSAIQNIIEAVENQNNPEENNFNETEFLILLNDLIDNDFNTLFKYIPPNKKYFVAAVPGSFYGRILPEASIDIGHCSTALHWLSKIPDEVKDQNSPAWNGGKVEYSGASKEVKNAYWNQYREDMEVFFRARAQEVVQGGLMILIVIGNPDDSLTMKGIGDRNFEILSACLHDMVKLGMITKEKMDLFNIPFYFPSPSEFMSSIEANGCFQVIKFETMDVPKDHNNDFKKNNNKKIDDSVHGSISHFRAVISGHISDHFGSHIVDYLFQLFTEKYYEDCESSCGSFRKLETIVFLKRKENEH